MEDEEVQGQITDPDVLATLAEVNENFRAQRELRLQEARKQALADYPPPPDSLTPGRGEYLEGDLPTPSATPPIVHPRPPRMRSQRPPENKPKPATTFADLCTLKVPRKRTGPGPC